MKRKLLMSVTAFALLCGATAAGSRLLPSGTGSNPFARHALGAASRYTLCGHVEERLPAGSYLYLRVRDVTGADHWVATLRAAAPDTNAVEVKVLARAEQFASKRLGRDFMPLHFGAVSGAPLCRSESTPSQELNP